MERTTDDGIAVTPSTAASATMYAYNPVVGKLWGGKRGGNALFCRVWEQFDFGRPAPLVLSPQNLLLACADGSASFTATGGKLPYTWSSTIGVMTPNADTKSATLKLNNPEVGGIAYYSAVATEGPDAIGIIAHSHFCDGSSPDFYGTSFFKSNSCTQIPFDFEDRCGFVSGAAGINCPSLILCDGMQVFCDQRTPQMIEAGCRPCALEPQRAGTVTVTGARGESATTTVTVK